MTVIEKILLKTTSVRFFQYWSGCYHWKASLHDLAEYKFQILIFYKFVVSDWFFLYFEQIFLRELISNASDALDKIRLLSLTDNSALEATSELSVRIKADKENNVLHVTDTGIGMSNDDLINQLGTIAKSGTSEFLQKMQVCYLVSLLGALMY